MQFVLERVKNIMGKGANAAYLYLTSYPTMVSKGFFLKVIKIADFVGKIFIKQDIS